MNRLEIFFFSSNNLKGKGQWTW